MRWISFSFQHTDIFLAHRPEQLQATNSAEDEEERKKKKIKKEQDMFLFSDRVGADKV